MIKKNLIQFFSALLIVFFSGITGTATAQVNQEKEKKSNPDIFFPDRKKKKDTSVITDREIKKERRDREIRRERKRDRRYDDRKNLPPGHQKKIYGDKSAKKYAPGQRKKRHDNDWQFVNEKKHDKNIKEAKKAKHKKHKKNKRKDD